jgi:TonB dependent receptor
MNRTIAPLSFALLCVCSLPRNAPAAEVDARPPNRLTLTASASRQDDVDDGGTGSLNYLHYLTPNALLGVGVEHQFIEEATLTFGSARAAWGRGEPSSRTTLFGEAHYGDGDDDGREYGYSVFALGINQALTTKLSLELEARDFDIDTTNGVLPKFGVSYLWSPRLLTYIAYAKSVSGNLGTELMTGRIDYFGSYFNLKLGGATGEANPAVLILQPGITLPATQSKQGYMGIGKTFKRGEVLFIADYLETGEVEKVTLTLSFTAYLGARVTR